MTPSQVLTNLIDPKLNFDKIFADFYVYKIRTDNLQGRYFAIIDEIKQTLTPIALVKSHSESQTFFILRTERLTTNGFKHFTASIIDNPGEIPTINWLRLLFRTLAITKEQAANPDPSLDTAMPMTCETGIYYCFEHSFYHGFLVCHAHAIDAETLTHHDDQIVLTIKSVCFTPKQAFAWRSDFQSKFAHLPTFNIQNFGDVTQLTKSRNKQSKSTTPNTNRDYIMRSPYKTRTSNHSIELNAKNPQAFFASKSGSLAKFMQDVRLYLSDYVTLDFQSINKDYQVDIQNKKQFDKHFTIMLHELGKHPIYLLKTDDISDTLCQTLQLYLYDTWQICAQLMTQIHTDDTNTKIYFLLHHESLYYDERGERDPYHTLQSAIAHHRDIAQSLTYEQIFTNDKINGSGLEKCLCELFIKLENQQQKLLLDDTPNQACQIIKPTLSDDYHKQIVGFHGTDYNPNDNHLAHWSLKSDIDNHAKDNQQFDDLSLLYQQLCYVMTGTMPAVYHHDDHLLIWHGDMMPKYYLIRTSNLLPIADVDNIHKIMTDIAKARQAGFQKQWAIDYLTQTADISDKLRGQLMTICQYSAPILPIDAFDKIGIAYKGAGKVFLDWVYDNYGYRYNYSFRTQNSSTVQAACGFYYNHQYQVYTAGLHDSPKGVIANFNHMRKVVGLQGELDQLAPCDDMPIQVFGLIENYLHIRHRQSTVLPFLCKHLREWIKQQQFVDEKQ
ncbi:hypothetical protein NGM44_07310 [Moraxella sp. FZFQ2102]|uniref:hypothetical protein n=1 Tax=Moraxella sp. FZFQ2102 TaxID=2953752 RepID=UPI00209C3ECA|nr:hypothetical protein [Moraxella sp. FZFQ2102]USZ14201.1 hypothetical protein NGM44_07310 [Moraxella sp. FZFQ2102]